MNEPTKELDRLIREALDQGDGDILDRFGEQSQSELLTEAFRGRHRMYAVGGIVANLILFVLGVFAAVRFVQAADQRSMMLWGAGAALCFGGVTVIKIWYWLEMTRLALAREIKRVELQVAHVAQTLADR